MPVITAAKRSSCAVCSQPIPVGEQIDYSAATGARHLACTDREPHRRTNRHAATCKLCRVRLKAGEGRLTLEADVPGADGGFVKRWAVECLDRSGCSERVSKGITTSQPGWRALRLRRGF